MKKILKLAALAFMCALTMVCTALFSSAADESGKWIAAWGTGPTNISLMDNIAFMGQDLSARTVITPTASGTKIRIKFTNYYGDSDSGLTLNNVTIAKSVVSDSTDPDAATSEIDLTTLKQVTFNGGSPIVNIPKGKEIYSDPIDFNVTAMENIAITFYAKESVEIRTMGLSGGTTYLSIGGDKTQDKSFGLAQSLGDDDVFNLIQSIFPSFNFEGRLSYKLVRVVPCVATVDVYSDEDAYAVAVVGDSTVSNEFPLYLADKINSYGVHNVGVMGKGVIGNTLSGQETSVVKNIYGEPLVDRFDNDIANQTNIKYVIIKIGANDIIHPVCGDNLGVVPQPTADDLIAGLKLICDKVHKMGAKAIVCTITQWKGTTRDYLGTGATYVRSTDEEEADWQIASDVNKWITDSTNKYHDGYVDVAKVSGPLEGDSLYGYFYPEYTEDAIHPNRELQQIWADKFPLSLIGVSKKVGNIRLTSSDKTLYINDGTGESFTLKVSEILPSDAKDKSVEWSISNSNVASISVSGSSVKVIAKKNGTAVITCKATDGSGVEATCKVTVKTRVSSVTLNSTKTSIYTRKTYQLTATVLPSNAESKKVTWKSSNTKVATVNSKGLVTGVGAGTATITCTSNDGLKKATCTVTVVKPTDVTGVSLNVSSKKINKGKTYQLTATIQPSNATFKSVKWKSSNSKIAKVSSTGLVTAVSAGTTYISCTSVDNPTAIAKVKITVYVKATGVSVKPTSISIYQTTTKTLKANITPSDVTNTKVTWTSSNTKIATVDENGVVTGVKPGKATITCKTASGGYTATCAVEVKKIVKTTKVTLSKESYTVKDGKTITLKPTIYPSNATLKNVTWTSSNKKIAKVNSKGVVTGVKPGKVTITCTTKDTGKKTTCTVTVKKVNPTSVELNKSKVTVSIGSTYKLKATVYPTNATNQNVTWTSSNTKVASVSSSGKVKAKAAGKATITCTTESGKKVATCVVTVPGVKITKVTLNKTSVKLAYGSTVTLKPTYTPSNASNKKVTWKSSNTKVAKVDSNGKVTAVGKGTATITCKPADGGKGKSATCQIEVYKTSVIGIKLNTSSLIMDKGATYQLKGIILPTTASDKRVMWTTSDVNVASVSSKGLVTARGTGTCTIKATAVDGGYVVTCKVQVK